MDDLAIFAKDIRIRVLRMLRDAHSSHIGSNYSIVEILTVLYKKFLRYDVLCPEWDERDRFILSKGHASAALYAILAEVGFFPREDLSSYYQDNSLLLGHISHYVAGAEVSTGSLGHGLGIGLGMALAAKRMHLNYRVVVLLSDGECNEGSVWEAAMLASHLGLDNLIAIIDYNKIQSLGFVHDVLKLEPLAEKWSSFGWQTQEVDGHNLDAIEQAFNSSVIRTKPQCIIAHTIKGKGVSFMENQVLWHYRSPQGDEYQAALEELMR